MQHARGTPLLDDAGNERPVGDAALVERDIRRQVRAHAGRQVVDDDHVMAGIEEGIDRVTADVAGAARDQNAAHRPHRPIAFFTSPSHEARALAAATLASTPQHPFSMLQTPTGQLWN